MSSSVTKLSAAIHVYILAISWIFSVEKIKIKIITLKIITFWYN